MLTLVLLPGMDGTGQLFAPLIDSIASGVRIQVVRYPPDEASDYRQLTDLVRQSLPPDGDYVLLGESFSGPIAVSIAAELPPRLKGLVMCCSFVTNPQPQFFLFGPLLRFFPIGLASNSLAVRSLLGRFATAPLCASLQAAIQSVSAETLRARLRAIISVDVKAELAKITVPMLYIKATRDRLVPTRASEAIQGIQPSVSIVEVEGPHFLLQANAKEAALHINNFLLGLQNAT